MSIPDNPAEETRGGENPDWANARPGEPLPEMHGTEQPADGTWSPPVSNEEG